MSYRLIKFFNPEAINEETGEKGVWQSVAVCEDKGEKGDKGDPFEYEDFTPDQLEALRGPVFTPSIDEDGNVSWENDGGLENPETKSIRGPQGIQGERGYHFTPSVDEQGNISWTNDGDLENPETKNIRGYHFTPSIDEDGNVSWENDGGLENPETKNVRGPQGEQGIQGIQGIQGERGFYFTPSVDEDCNLSWTNDGGLENPKPINIRGYDADIIYSNTPPENTSALWVVDDNTSKGEVVTSESVNRIEIVDEYPEHLEENVLYIKVK